MGLVGGKASMATKWLAGDTFSTRVAGVRRVFVRNTLYWPDDIKGLPKALRDTFTKVEVDDADEIVESTSQSPGQKRTRVRKK